MIFCGLSILGWTQWWTMDLQPIRQWDDVIEPYKIVKECQNMKGAHWTVNWTYYKLTVLRKELTTLIIKLAELQVFSVFTASKIICGNVMFSHASVKLFTAQGVWGYPQLTLETTKPGCAYPTGMLSCYFLVLLSRIRISPPVVEFSSARKNYYFPCYIQNFKGSQYTWSDLQRVREFGYYEHLGKRKDYFLIRGDF